jgi:hypothetical protein
MRKLTVILAAGLVFGASGMAMAATNEAAMTVTATLTNACIVSEASMNFGDFAALVGTGDKTANTGTTLTVACTTGTSPTIWSDSTRTLVPNGAGPSIPFSLSQTAGAAINDLPIESGTPEPISGYSADGTLKTVMLYGRILETNFRNKPADTYTASIQVKVDY